jgi:DNA-directed RNA polymerase subunit RPC12/RpoP
MNSLLVTPKSDGKNPFTIVCFICGREYGTKSIEIHEKQCMEKWEKTNKELPKAMKRPRPVKPKQNPDLPIKGSYNDDAFQAYQENTLFPCDSCGRKVFLID